MPEPDSRAIVIHLRAEHRRMRERVQAVERLLAPQRNVNESPTCEEVVGRLRTLRQELQNHFDEEDSGGCLDAAVCGNPKLSRELSQLEHEHPELLARLDDVIAHANSSEGSIGDQTYQEFKRLTKKLHAHEDTENRIIANGFGLELDEVE